MIDVLLCAGPGDIHGLFPLCLRLLFANCRWVGRVHIVTPDPEAARPAIATLQASDRERISLHADRDLVGDRGMALPGWFRQQYIKLNADAVCATENLVCLGADALILEPVKPDDFIAGSLPVHRYFRYEHPARHLYFERERILNVARLISLNPARSFLPGDFICDFFPMNRSHLRALRDHIDGLYGPDGLGSRLALLGPESRPDNRFGEWSIYTVFVLDGLGADVALRLGELDWARQVHSRHDMLRDDRYAARIVHFVQEPGGTDAVIADLVATGRLRRELA